MSRNRRGSDLKTEYNLYFDRLEKIISYFNVEPRHIYAMDQKSFEVGIISPNTAYVCSKAALDRGDIMIPVQEGNREWISVLACVCADGSSVPPTLIYQSDHGGLESNWLEDLDSKIHSAHLTSTRSGRTNKDISFDWLKQVFERYTKEKTQNSYRLLLLNPRGLHIQEEFIRYCYRNKILLIMFPPQSSHTLQPLRVGMFKPLSTAYSEAASKFRGMFYGYNPIEKDDFFKLFWEAWVGSFTEQRILNSFKVTGISPLDPETVLSKIAKDDPDDQGSAESSVRVHVPCNRDEIERLLKAVLEHADKTMSQKLTESVRSMITENEQMLLESKRLRDALAEGEETEGEDGSLGLEERQPQSKEAEKKKKKKRTGKASTRVQKQTAHQTGKQHQRRAQTLKKKSKVYASNSSRADVQEEQVVDPGGDGTKALSVASKTPRVTTRSGRNVNPPSKYL
jgi:hypothetical protein